LIAIGGQQGNQPAGKSGLLRKNTIIVMDVHE